ncbi:dihydroorotase [Methanocella paludicola SANAE]|uniref:Dihydroorotase n=1 Tax=Methanocella paludicola (strain DSM 17711 / JCM 13418 / NBRC 101707 / SANAE) TaxID=304371 RepID=D1YUQ9_METPS|nr:dihydroorotase [Methanocella paludicola]BAI60181.1 dihydroorotase [Methanocella paludicola SANAE]
MHELVVENARVPFGEDIVTCSIGIDEGRIARIAKILKGEQAYDARNMLVLPGVIDSHVHFRDMGQEEKEDWLSGSRAAIYGGVTAVVDMPNTDPPTFDEESFKIKLTVAQNRSMIDFAINGGVSGNLKALPVLWRRGALAFGEIFMAKSTGGFSVDEQALKAALLEIKRLGATASIHAEDEALNAEKARELARDDSPDVYSQMRPPGSELNAVKAAVRLEHETGAAMHITHISTAKAVEALRGEPITCDVTPHHLLLNMRHWEKLKSYGKMNPPLRPLRDVEALWKAARDGSIDVLASDHAPHTREEKAADIRSAPSGVPGVETMAPLILKEVADGRLPLQRFIDMTTANPARIFGINNKGRIEEGYDADLIFVDMGARRVIRPYELHSKAGWTPYEGMEAIFPHAVMQRGTLLLDGKEFLGRRGRGKFIRGRGYERKLPGRTS